MKRVVCSAILLSMFSAPGLAQSHTMPDWAAEIFGDRRGGSPQSRIDLDDDERDSARQQRPWGDPVRDGGPRPDISPQAPPVVDFPYSYAANSIVIDTGGRRLYYVLAGNRAYAYPIGVGREGFGWSGTEKISRKQAWPDWHPPAEMRERDPSLPEKMTGGVRNPLGAMALYLGTSLYRVHGTNDARSIGKAQSSGCFRMMNSAVLHLAQHAQVGATVAVVRSLPRGPRVSRAPAPEPKAVLVNASEAPSAPDTSPAAPQEAPIR